MSLLNRIKEASLVARKAGNRVSANLLTTLYAEASKVGKDKGNRESTDDEVVATIRKFIKNNEQVLEVRQDIKTLEEQAILHTYLPYILTDEDINDVLNYIAGFQTLSMKSMGAVKARIDQLWPGSYDGARVSAALKARIS